MAPILDLLDVDRRRREFRARRRMLSRHCQFPLLFGEGGAVSNSTQQWPSTSPRLQVLIPPLLQLNAPVRSDLLRHNSLSLLLFLLFFLAICAVDARHRIPLQTSPLPIIAGEPTIADKFAFQAAVVVGDTTGKAGSFCGASILSAWYALTAAHCFGGSAYTDVRGHAHLNDPNTTVTIIYGSNEQPSPESTSGSRVNASELWVYKEFNNPEMSNDFAIVKFAFPIHMSDQVQSIRLSPNQWGPRELPEGADITISGWGKSSVDPLQPPPPFLLSLTSNHLPYLCKERFPEVFRPELMICSGCTQNGTGVCNGDSGGPATVASSSGGGAIQVGILSWAASPCATGPAVLAPVANVLPWIESIVGIPLRSTVQAAPTFDCDTCPPGSPRWAVSPNSGGGQATTADSEPAGVPAAAPCAPAPPQTAAALRSSTRSCDTHDALQASVESLLPSGFRVHLSPCKEGQQTLRAYYRFDAGGTTQYMNSQRHPQSKKSQSQSQREVSKKTQQVLGRISDGMVVFLQSTRGIGTGKIRIAYRSSNRMVLLNTPLTKPELITADNNNKNTTTSKYSGKAQGWEVMLRECAKNITYAALYLLTTTEPDAAFPHYYQISLPVGKTDIRMKGIGTNETSDSADANTPTLTLE